MRDFKLNRNNRLNRSSGEFAAGSEEALVVEFDQVH